jgi:hypothetical protein
MTVSGIGATEKAKELGRLQGEMENSEGLYLEFLERHEAANEELKRMS